MGGAAAAVSGNRGRSGEGRRRFGRLLAEALKARGMKQGDLARLLGTTQSSVSGWINGKYEPAAGTVFTIERTMDMEPGHLSRPLGYLPVDATPHAVGVEGAIDHSTALDDEEKAALIAVYRVLVKDAATKARPARAGATSGARSRGRPTIAAPATRPRPVAGGR